jgi:hypothetical protein
MRKVVVRYKTKPEHSDENQRLVDNVFEELAATKPAGLRYATFRLADDVTFVHVASIETDDGSNPLGQTASFKEFQANLSERCDEPPAAQDATVVGSYRLLAE